MIALKLTKGRKDLLHFPLWISQMYSLWNLIYVRLFQDYHFCRLSLTKCSLKPCLSGFERRLRDRISSHWDAISEDCCIVTLVNDHLCQCYFLKGKGFLPAAVKVDNRFPIPHKISQIKRAGYFPVIILALLVMTQNRRHSIVNRIPSAARWSMFGVL